eukprot:6212782-Pleurochrysis_carterae.AAC.4
MSFVRSHIQSLAESGEWVPEGEESGEEEEDETSSSSEEAEKNEAWKEAKDSSMVEDIAASRATRSATGPSHSATPQVSVSGAVLPGRRKLRMDSTARLISFYLLLHSSSLMKLHAVPRVLKH